MACTIGAMESGNPAISLGATALAVVTVLRIAAALALPRLIPTADRLLEVIYQLGGFAYAAITGLIAAMAVGTPMAGPVRMLMVGNAIAYAAGIGARNAARPAIAIGQAYLTLVPVILIAIWQPDLASRALGIALLMMILVSTSITLNLSRVLRGSIASAQTSQRLAEKMQHLARSDSLTGLLNRAGLNRHLVEQLVTVLPSRKLALLWLDLDRFKEINDTLGHHIGDRCLIEVAGRLRRMAPAGAGVARFGGDEFIVVFAAESDTQIAAMAKAILAEIHRAIRIEDNRLEITCSIGIATLPDHGADSESLLQAADLALHQAKQAGRGRIVHFEQAMTHHLVSRKEIEADLRLALQRDELSVFFQPVIDLTNGRIRAFEALVRWFHPEKGALRPDEFIPIAEETGAIITLGNWITAKAARVAADWPDDVILAVNLSPLQIRAPGAALAIMSALREAKLAPHRLELEITETVLLDHSPATAAFIAELSAAGVRFALDDFGTGYSSLAYLAKYPFGKIKIDRSFVSNIATCQTDLAIVRAVSTMGHALGMTIVAEGLETLEQVKAARDAGCTQGQGWYFSRAVPDYMASMLLAQERRRHSSTWLASLHQEQEETNPAAARKQA